MARALPILVILGLAVYSFFDVLQTKPGDFRRFSRTSWLVIVLIPILGAALWFIAGRPRRSRKGYGPPRIISLRGSQRQIAPDDDPTFIRKLDEEAWRRKRDKARDDEAQGKNKPDDDQPDGDSNPPREGPAPGGPGISPA